MHSEEFIEAAGVEGRRSNTCAAAQGREVAGEAETSSPSSCLSERFMAQHWPFRCARGGMHRFRRCVQLGNSALVFLSTLIPLCFWGWEGSSHF